MINLLYSLENLSICIDLYFYKWVQIYHLVQCKFARGHFNRKHGRGHSTQPLCSLYNLMPSCRLNQYFFDVSITQNLWTWDYHPVLVLLENYYSWIQNFQFWEGPRLPNMRVWSDYGYMYVFRQWHCMGYDWNLTRIFIKHILL